MYGFILLFLCWKKQHRLGELSVINLVLVIWGAFVEEFVLWHLEWMF